MVAEYVFLPRFHDHVGPPCTDEWDSTLGFPGEGPRSNMDVFTRCITVDECVDGRLWLDADADQCRQLPRSVRRGPRRRMADRSWALVAANVTSWNRVHDLFAWFQRQRLKVDVLSVQELMKPADQMQQVKAGLARSGWEEFAVPSNRTVNGGLSAGAAVLVRSTGLASQIETEDVQKKHLSRF